MAKLLTRNQTLGRAAPGLVFYHQVEGLLVPPATLDFQVVDVSTPAKENDPVPVYPVSGWAAVDLSLIGGDTLGPGRYAPTWAVPANQPLGAHEVRWRWRETLTSPLRFSQERFDVAQVGLPPGATLYALPSELRAEGVASSKVSDARLVTASLRAAQVIERITRRFFEPRYLELRADGRGGRAVLLEMPIIAVDELRFDSLGVLVNTTFADSDNYRVYNRHLQGVVQPDDRQSPRIELYGLRDAGSRASYGDLRFPRGQQNIVVRGVFGFTEADGSPYGATPVLLREAAMRLAIRNAGPLGSSQASGDRRYAGRITSERTRDQSVTYSAGSSTGLGAAAANGAFTGDAEVDFLLGLFLAPPQMGAA